MSVSRQPINFIWFPNKILFRGYLCTSPCKTLKKMAKAYKNWSFWKCLHDLTIHFKCQFTMKTLKNTELLENKIKTEFQRDMWQFFNFNESVLAGIYLFKVNNRNTTGGRYEIFLKLTIKTPEWRHPWCCSCVFIVNCEHISYIVLVFLLNFSVEMLAGIGERLGKLIKYK